MNTKKYLLIAASLVLSSTILTSSTYAREVEPGNGDVNKDGTTNVLDALLIRQYLDGIKNISLAQKWAGDVDGNGELSTNDADMIMQRDIGIITTLPYEEDDFAYNNVLFGDTDGNGDVNSVDALKIEQYAQNMISLNLLQLYISDVNASDSVNTEDANLILQEEVGLISCFPVMPDCDEDSSSSTAPEDTQTTTNTSSPTSKDKDKDKDNDNKDNKDEKDSDKNEASTNNEGSQNLNTQASPSVAQTVTLDESLIVNPQDKAKTIKLFGKTIVPNTRFMLTIYSDPIRNELTSDENGNWEYELAPDTLPAGEHRITVAYFNWDDSMSEETEIAKIEVVNNDSAINTKIAEAQRQLSELNESTNAQMGVLKLLLLALATMLILVLHRINKKHLLILSNQNTGNAPEVQNGTKEMATKIEETAVKKSKKASKNTTKEKK